MEWDEVKDTVRNLLPEMKAGSGGWMRSHCPFCVSVNGRDDKRYSFGLNIASCVFHCFRCGTTGHFPEAREFFGTTYDALPDAAPIDAEPTEIGPPTNCEPIWKSPFATAWTYAPAREYLAGRENLGDRALWKKANVHACINGEFKPEGVFNDDGSQRVQRVKRRIVVPVLARDGKTWLGWSARDWTNRAVRKYLYPGGMNRGTILYNHSVLDIETDEPALIMEGVFDVLPHFDNAVGCLGKPSKWQKSIFKEARRPLVVCLDGDAWEEGQALSFLLRINGVRAGFVKLPPKRDPGDIDPGWLKEEARQSLKH